MIPLSFEYFNTMTRWLELAYTTHSEKDFDLYVHHAAQCRACMEMHLALEIVASKRFQ